MRIEKQSAHHHLHYNLPSNFSYLRLKERMAWASFIICFAWHDSSSLPTFSLRLHLHTDRILTLLLQPYMIHLFASYRISLTHVWQLITHPQRNNMKRMTNTCVLYGSHSLYLIPFLWLPHTHNAGENHRSNIFAISSSSPTANPSTFASGNVCLFLSEGNIFHHAFLGHHQHHHNLWHNGTKWSTSYQPLD